ncbi:hypothetical protein HDV64DRAFT_204533 [Trichoderma sp. TUCIM 5745]
MHEYPAVVSNNNTGSSRSGQPWPPFAFHTVRILSLPTLLDRPHAARRAILCRSSSSVSQQVTDSKQQRQESAPISPAREQKSQKKSPTCRKPAARNLAGFPDRRRWHKVTLLAIFGHCPNGTRPPMSGGSRTGGALIASILWSVKVLDLLCFRGLAKLQFRFEARAVLSDCTQSKGIHHRRCSLWPGNTRGFSSLAMTGV